MNKSNLSLTSSMVTLGVLAPTKMSVSPTEKHTGQESEGELCESFKFWWFLQSKSAKSVFKKLLQLL